MGLRACDLTVLRAGLLPHYGRALAATGEWPRYRPCCDERSSATDPAAGDHWNPRTLTRSRWTAPPGVPQNSADGCGHHDRQPKETPATDRGMSESAIGGCRTASLRSAGN